LKIRPEDESSKVSQVSVKNSNPRLQLRDIGERLAGGLKIGAFNQSSLIRLVDVIMSRLREPANEAQALIHIPKSFTTAIADRLSLSEKPQVGSFYLCNFQPDNGAQIGLEVSGELTQRHSFRSELILIFIGRSLCALLTAWQEKNVNQKRTKPLAWKVAISFNPQEVLAGTQHIEQILSQREDSDAHLLQWLGGAAEKLRSFPLTEAGYRSWEDYLPDFIIDQEQQRLVRERELKWFRLISRVQDAVGWELDTSKLFAAISQVLKSTIGFHYLEIQILEPRGKKYDVTAVHHRNDTAFGGKLLSVILRPESRETIMRSLKPIVIDAKSAEKTLMNPRLMKYMSIESGIIVPLVYQKRANGMLKLFANNKNHFIQDDLPGMEAIGRILARSIENVKIHTLMKRMATVDGLTNLYNRRFFTEQITREFKRSSRYQSSLSLIMIDIDHFKHYNDSFGHLRGDEALVTVGRLVKACVREVDIVARYGGEEFAVILPEANLERGMLVAEKIRSAIESHKFKFGNRQPGGALTLSLGVASNTADVENINELINRSDVALYRAKKAGRNRCEPFE
jgi:diguanylate cyclase (GGDEF)-like protein